MLFSGHSYFERGTKDRAGASSKDNEIVPSVGRETRGRSLLRSIVPCQDAFRFECVSIGVRCEIVPLVRDGVGEREGGGPF